MAKTFRKLSDIIDVDSILQRADKAQEHFNERLILTGATKIKGQKGTFYILNCWSADSGEPVNISSGASFVVRTVDEIKEQLGNGIRFTLSPLGANSYCMRDWDTDEKAIMPEINDIPF